MKRLLPLFALSLMLSGCYGQQIACLRDQVEELQASSVSQREVRQILWQENEDIRDGFAMLDNRIDKMVSDMNRMNVCPRQLNHRLSNIEKKLGIKSPRFGPDWQYRVSFDDGTLSTNSVVLTSIYASSFTTTTMFSTSTYFIVFDSAPVGTVVEIDAAGGAEGALSRAQRSQRYIE